MSSGGTVTWESALENLRSMFPDRSASELSVALERCGACSRSGAFCGAGGAARALRCGDAAPPPPPAPWAPHACLAHPSPSPPAPPPSGGALEPCVELLLGVTAGPPASRAPQPQPQPQPRPQSVRGGTCAMAWHLLRPARRAIPLALPALPALCAPPPAHRPPSSPSYPAQRDDRRAPAYAHPLPANFLRLPPSIAPPTSGGGGGSAGGGGDTDAQLAAMLQVRARARVCVRVLCVCVCERGAML